MVYEYPVHVTTFDWSAAPNLVLPCDSRKNKQKNH